MRKVSDSISNYLWNQMSDFSKNQTSLAVIRFGIETILSLFYSLSAILVVAYLFDVTIPTLWFLLSVNILRAFSGGAHCSSVMRCSITGAIFIPTLSWLSDSYYLSNNYYLDLLMFFLGLIFILIFAPKDNPQKPIIGEEYRKKLKKLSMICYTGLFLLALLINVKGPLIIGCLWQIFSITLWGEIFIKKVDTFLKRIGI